MKTSKKIRIKTIIVLTIILILVTSKATAQPVDKVKHFAAGAIIAAGTSMIVYDLTKSRKKARLYSIVASVLAGIAKEGLDQHRYGGWDNNDLAATALGGLSTVYVSLTIEVFKPRRRNLFKIKRNKRRA